MKEAKRCHRCRTEIMAGSFCSKCSYELAMGIKTYISSEIKEEATIRNPMGGRMRYIGVESKTGRCLCR